MTLYNDPNKRRELIMKHYSKPSNKVEQDLEWEKYDYYSDACVDEIHLFIKEENDAIEDIKFSGKGCAIFIASTDLMLNTLKGKSITEVKKIAEEYNKMIHGQAYNQDLLDELNIFQNVEKNFNRLHCAEMVYLALKQYIEKK